MLYPKHTKKLSCWHHFKQVITGKQHPTKDRAIMQPMAFMLDETKAYKSDYTANDALSDCLDIPTTAQPASSIISFTNAPTRSITQESARRYAQSYTTTSQTLHRVLRGTPTQICNELDALVAQEMLQQHRI